MPSEGHIARATVLILDRLEVGYIAVENDRELHREIGAGDLSIGAVRRAMSRLIRHKRVTKVSPRRHQLAERGVGTPKTVYALRNAV